MALGECGNFAAYCMAPLSLVAPLDAIAILSNIILSREKLSDAGAVGVATAVVGIVVVTLYAPHEGVYDSDRALLYFLIACCVAIWMDKSLGIVISRATRQSSVIFNCFRCGLMGTIAVVSIKCTLVEARDMHDIKIYILLATAISSIVLQLKYLVTAFTDFESRLVVPTYYIIFTGMTLLAGKSVFMETVPHFFVYGLILTCIGVVIVTHENSGMHTDFDKLCGDDMKCSLV